MKKMYVVFLITIVFLNCDMYSSEGSQAAIKFREEGDWLLLETQATNNEAQEAMLKEKAKNKKRWRSLITAVIQNNKKKKHQGSVRTLQQQQLAIAQQPIAQPRKAINPIEFGSQFDPHLFKEEWKQCTLFFSRLFNLAFEDEDKEGPGDKKEN